MCKKISFLLLSVVLSSFVSAQDIIVTKDSRKIEGRILEVNTADIKYRLKNNPDGPLYTLSKADISSVIYESGEVETFKVDKGANTIPAQPYIRGNNAESVSTGPLYPQNKNNKYVAAPKPPKPVPAPKPPKYKLPESKPEITLKGCAFYADKKKISAGNYRFLAEKFSPEAYSAYINGHKKKSWGIALFSIGLPLAVTGSIMIYVDREKATEYNHYLGYTFKETTHEHGIITTLGYTFVGIGSSAVIASLPLWIKGAKEIKKSVKSFNDSKVQTPVKISLNFNITSNGLGLAFNF